MIGEDHQADQRFRLRLHGFELPDPDRVPDAVFAPDPVIESPLWQQHNRMMQRDATNRRN